MLDLRQASLPLYDPSQVAVLSKSSSNKSSNKDDNNDLDIEIIIKALKWG
jgi:hypothetical protein